MCVGGLRPVCRELHAGELETRPQRARQAEAEAFLAADQASDPMVEAATVSLTTGGRRSTDSGAHAYAASGDAHAYADGGGARTYAGASRARAYVTEGRAVRCGVLEQM
jgi:hypothetical protein